jgi:hypothetical protein
VYRIYGITRIIILLALDIVVCLPGVPEKKISRQYRYIWSGSKARLFYERKEMLI